MRNGRFLREIERACAKPAEAPPLRRILVPLDGSALADRILVPLQPILASQDARVTLLRVVPRDGPPEALPPGEEAPDAHLDRVREDLSAEGVDARCAIRRGDAAAEILRFADHHEPSLVAMSTHGRTGVSRFLRGSVAERILRGSRHPILLANPICLYRRHDSKTAPFPRILLPLDASEASAKILPLAEAFARAYRSEVVLVHALPIHPVPSEFPHVATEAEGEAILDPFREYFARRGIPARVRIEFDDAASAVLDAASAEKADLVAMTTHGRSGVSRWVFGSVAEKVVRDAPCPILVLRPAAVRAARRGSMEPRSVPA